MATRVFAHNTYVPIHSGRNAVGLTEFLSRVS